MADLLVRLLQDGYLAVARDREERGGGDTYVSRLTGRRAVVVRGEAGARLFYDESTTQRRRAMPLPLRGLLFGPGAVHGLDGEAHVRRKELFLDVLGAEDAQRLGAAVRAELAARTGNWAASPRPVHVFDELVDVYGRCVIAWAGIDLPAAEASRTAREMMLIVDGFGGAGRAYPRGWLGRTRSHRWAARVLREARTGSRPVRRDTVLGRLVASDLPLATAATELLNVLRPTVAVAWLGTFAAVRLGGSAAERERLATGDRNELLRFAQEVRRTAPFVPVLAARAKRRVEHDGVVVHPGDFVVLDVWGTDHVPSRWPDPDEFRPERHAEPPGDYDLVPQGGGPLTGHRCPGESVTLSLLIATAVVLSRVEVEALGTAEADLARMPTRPDDRLLVSGPSKPGG